MYMFILIIIIMMIIVKNLSKLPKRSLTLFPSYSNSNPQNTQTQQKRLKNFQRIRSAIDRELQQQPAEELEKYEKIFKQKGWDIRYRQKIIELAKEVNPYSLKIIVNSKINVVNRKRQELTQRQEQEGVQQDEEEEVGEQQMTNIYVQISNEKMPLHMLLTYCLIPEKMPILLKVEFVKEKQLDSIKCRKLLDLQNASNYEGPQINWLNSEIQALLHLFMNDIVKLDMTWKALFPYVLAYEHNLYLEWLKDFKSIL